MPPVIPQAIYAQGKQRSAVAQLLLNLAGQAPGIITGILAQRKDEEVTQRLGEQAAELLGDPTGPFADSINAQQYRAPGVIVGQGGAGIPSIVAPPPQAQVTDTGTAQSAIAALEMAKTQQGAEMQQAELDLALAGERRAVQAAELDLQKFGLDEREFDLAQRRQDYVEHSGDRSYGLDVERVEQGERSLDQGDARIALERARFDEATMQSEIANAHQRRQIALQEKYLHIAELQERRAAAREPAQQALLDAQLAEAQGAVKAQALQLLDVRDGMHRAAGEKMIDRLAVDAANAGIPFDRTASLQRWMQAWGTDDLRDRVLAGEEYSDAEVALRYNDTLTSFIATEAGASLAGVQEIKQEMDELRPWNEELEMWENPTGEDITQFHSNFRGSVKDSIDQHMREQGLSWPLNKFTDKTKLAEIAEIYAATQALYQGFWLARGGSAQEFKDPVEMILELYGPDAIDDTTWTSLIGRATTKIWQGPGGA
jgi:hypothetical protein